MAYGDNWGLPLLSAEETTNDSDKTFTVTTGKVWQIQSIWVELASTATVGNRQMSVAILDSDNDVLARVEAGAVQAASVTRYYLFAPTVAELTSMRNTSYLSTQIPAWVLPPGYKIRVWDSTAVDAAADDMVVQMLVIQRAP